jgi:predicted nucleic acid-binding protein
VIAFLDASALIYLMDGEAPWAQSTQVTLQQLAVEAPDLTLAVTDSAFWSVVLRRCGGAIKPAWTVCCRLHRAARSYQNHLC